MEGKQFNLLTIIKMPYAYIVPFLDKGENGGVGRGGGLIRDSNEAWIHKVSAAHW